MTLLCRIFGHKLVVREGDCFIASSETSCTAKAEWLVCTRGDYHQMLPHKHIDLISARKLTKEGDSKLHDLAARLFKERQDKKIAKGLYTGE
jgi:hypothetical protein